MATQIISYLGVHNLTFTLHKYVPEGDSCSQGEVLDTVVLKTDAKV